MCTRVCVLHDVTHAHTQQGSLPAVLGISTVGNRSCAHWELQTPVPCLLFPTAECALVPSADPGGSSWSIGLCSFAVALWPQEGDLLHCSYTSALKLFFHNNCVNKKPRPVGTGCV